MAKRIALWQAMQDANVTGKELAELLGISEARYSQMLNGDRMHEDQIKIVCEQLGISADVIVFSEPAIGSNEYEAEFLRLYRTKLNHVQRIRMIQFMREMPEQS